MSWQLAQLNVARSLTPLEDPVMADFVAVLGDVNAGAEASPGFVWRWVEEEGDTTAARVFGDERWLVNLSVWTSVESLVAFVRSGDHLAIMRRRGEWFRRLGEAHLVLWWVPAGHRPTVEEAAARLEWLRREGPSIEAFDFRTTFGAPGSDGD